MIGNLFEGVENIRGKRDYQHFLAFLCCLPKVFFDRVLSSLPNDKMYSSKSKAFADDKINVNENFKFVLERVENIVANGENAGYQHFLHFPLCFQKAFFLGSLKLWTTL